MAIERLTPQHAPEYRALMLNAYAQHPEAFTSSVAEREKLPLSWWCNRLSESDEPTEVVFGIFSNGQLAGAVGLAFEVREKTRHKATLFGMMVAPQFRGQGMGAQLLAHALKFAKARPGILMVQLTVSESNDVAQRLYAQHGFETFGVEPMAVAVGSGFVAKVHMACRLQAP